MGVRKSSNHFSNAIKSPYLASSKAVIQNLNVVNSNNGAKPLTSTTPESPKIQNSKYFHQKQQYLNDIATKSEIQSSLKPKKLNTTQNSLNVSQLKKVVSAATSGIKDHKNIQNSSQVLNSTAAATTTSQQVQQSTNKLTGNYQNIKKIIGKQNPYLQSLIKKMQLSGVNLIKNDHKKNLSTSPNRYNKQNNKTQINNASKVNISAGAAIVQDSNQIENLKDLIQQLIKSNNQLEKENKQHRSKLKAVESEYQKLQNSLYKSEDKVRELAIQIEEMYQFFSQCSFELNQNYSNRQHILNELVKTLSEKETMQVNIELDKSRLEMKIKLLEETLTKRNKQYEASEESNKQLLYLLERYDSKVSDLRQQIDLKQLRLQHYQQLNPGVKFSLDQLQDRIKFLVQLLEKYKAQLQTISDDKKDRKNGSTYGGNQIQSDIFSDAATQALKMKLKNHSICSSPPAGKYKRMFSQDLKEEKGIQNLDYLQSSNNCSSSGSDDIDCDEDENDDDDDDDDGDQQQDKDQSDFKQGQQNSQQQDQDSLQNKEQQNDQSQQAFMSEEKEKKQKKEQQDDDSLSQTNNKLEDTQIQNNLYHPSRFEKDGDDEVEFEDSLKSSSHPK